MKVEKYFVRSYQSGCAAPSFQTVRATKETARATAIHKAPRYPNGRIVVDGPVGEDASSCPRNIIWED